MFSHSDTDGRENDSGSRCKSPWKLGPLAGVYTTPCCRALFHLDPVAKRLFGKLKASPSPTGFSGSPLWPFALFRVLFSFCCGTALCKSLSSPPHVLLDCVPGRGRTGHILAGSPHSRLRWASSCLNQSTQVSWVVSWKAYRRRGVPVFI